MRSRSLTLTLIAACCALWAACGGNGGDRPAQTTPTRDAAADEAAVRAVFEREFALSTSDVGQELYDLYSPAFQATCPFDRFVAAKSPSPDDRYPRERQRIENLRVVLSGDTARLAYDYVFAGQTLSIVTADKPDLFTRIDGRWYDDADTQTTCDK